MDATSAHWIFRVVSRRYERGSIVLTSNRAFGDWGQVFADQVVASTILDRLLHHATVVRTSSRPLICAVGGPLAHDVPDARGAIRLPDTLDAAVAAVSRILVPDATRIV